MRETFERAILANPDDVAGYAAYADWLQEQDDPRGEFIAVQIALEDESRPAVERKQLQHREAELLAAHEREWLGELAPFLLDPDRPAPAGYTSSTDGQHRWRWGFLSFLSFVSLSPTSAQALAGLAAAKLLRELRVGSDYYAEDASNEPQQRVPTPPGVRSHSQVFELIGADCLKNLRVFHYGDDEAEPPEDGWTDCHTGAEGLEHVIATMPRVEELDLLCKDYDMGALFALPNLTNLRVLRAYHQGGYGRDSRYEYPLDILAANPALANLTHLIFHPHQPEGGDGDPGDSYLPLEQVRHLVNGPHLKSLTHLQLRLSDMGDPGVEEFVRSGILKRLTWLDLRHGAITDEGARLFAACPDANKLERLDLSRNGVTTAGLAALRAAGVNAVANNPLTDDELAAREYLREGDFE
jgi:uncharacterized protein (TIGR02996 family)